MTRVGRGFAAVGGAVTVVLMLVAGPASAVGGGLQRCLDQAADHDGEPPVCTKVDGTWVASWPDDGGGGVAGAMVALLIIGTIVGVTAVAWRVSTARRLAQEAGMDPTTAGQLAFLSEDGLNAAYLASSLQRPPADHGTVAERLAELGSLRDQGVITQAEHDERRRAIIAEV